MFRPSDTEFLNSAFSGAICDAAFEGRFFETLLDHAERILPDARILFHGVDAVQPAGNFLLHRGLKPDAIRSYTTELNAHDPWFNVLWQQPVGRIYQDSDLLDRESFLKTPFYRTWLSRQSPLVCASGLVIHRNGNVQWVLEIRYSEDQARTMRPKATDFLASICDAALRAAKVFMLRIDPPHLDESTNSLLELMPFPIFILDSAGMVINLNSKAAMTTKRLDSMFIGADGHLNAIDAAGHADLQNAIHKLGSSGQRNSELLIIHKGDGTGLLFLSLTTLGSSMNHAARRFGPQQGTESRIALIAQDANMHLGLTHEVLWRAFGLSSAESELAMSLVNGARISDCASQHEISKQTLRNQLLSIMRKTNTHRQPELVALLTRMAMSASF